MTDRLRRADSSTLNIAGPVGDYIENQKRQWLLIAPHANPAMLEMMRDRDNRPLREMVPWAGEFAGKYLTRRGRGHAAERGSGSAGLSQ